MNPDCTLPLRDLTPRGMRSCRLPLDQYHLLATADLSESANTALMLVHEQACANGDNSDSLGQQYNTIDLVSDVTSVPQHLDLTHNGAIRAQIAS